MGIVVQLEQRRRVKAAERSFGRWQRRVEHQPGPETRISDLPDTVLARLAELDREATLALYDLVLGVRDWGPGERFHYLESREKVAALDAFLFLADQVRFDLMRRLGWVEGVASESYSLLEMAAQPLEIQASFLPQVPRLTTAYHRFSDVEARLAYEPGAVVRSLIPEALLVFRMRRQGGETS